MEEKTIRAVVGSVTGSTKEPHVYIVGLLDDDEPTDPEYTWLTVRTADGDFLPQVGDIVEVSVPQIRAVWSNGERKA